MTAATWDIRWVAMQETLRYAKGSDPLAVELDGYLNYHYATGDPAQSRPRLLLESGINAPQLVNGSDGAQRRPVLAIRSSPWKAGGETTPWHDEFDLDHGHVRYFGDHKVNTMGMPGSTRGNSWLLEAWRLHRGVKEEERLLAPPLLLFRSVTVSRGGRSQVKGFVEFCGAAIIERLEHIVQRDPRTGRSFPNIAVDLAVVAANESDRIDMRWLDDRCDPRLTARESLRHAPSSWARWVREGRSAISRVRRRVLVSRVKGTSEQLPDPGSVEAEVLHDIYRFYDGRKHSFELLAARVAEAVLSSSGSLYHSGWLTRSSGDGGVDFVGRLDVGGLAANTPVVVLGQAKCIAPRTSVSPDQVARLVARLRRGWIGIYVTTGSFSRQAQVEIIDDQYPVVMVNGRVLAEEVRRIAASDFDGSVKALLTTLAGEQEQSILSRRPEEILSG